MRTRATERTRWRRHTVYTAESNFININDEIAEFVIPLNASPHNTTWVSNKHLIHAASQTTTDKQPNDDSIMAMQAKRTESRIYSTIYCSRFDASSLRLTQTTPNTTIPCFMSTKDATARYEENYNQNYTHSHMFQRSQTKRKIHFRFNGDGFCVVRKGIQHICMMALRNPIPGIVSCEGKCARECAYTVGNRCDQWFLRNCVYICLFFF